MNTEVYTYINSKKQFNKFEITKTYNNPLVINYEVKGCKEKCVVLHSIPLNVPSYGIINTVLITTENSEIVTYFFDSEKVTLDIKELENKALKITI